MNPAISCAENCSTYQTYTCLLAVFKAIAHDLWNTYGDVYVTHSCAAGPSLPLDFKIILLLYWSQHLSLTLFSTMATQYYASSLALGVLAKFYNMEKLSFFFPASGGRKQWVPPICCSCKVPWGESCILPHSTKLKRGGGGGAVRLIDSLCHVCSIF